MTRRLVVGILKGGAGKSTTASQMAVWMALLGQGPILVGDADTDQTSFEWVMSVREKLLAAGGGDKARFDAVDLTAGRTRRLHDLERNYRYSVIDVEPKREELLREVLRQPKRDERTDLIIPIKPYPADVRKLPQTIALAKEVDQHNPVFPRALLVQVRLSASHATDFPKTLDEAGIPRFKTMIKLKESIGYSLNTTFVDEAYADVLAELGITGGPSTGKE